MKGFTLIETIIVFAIIAMIAVFGFWSFSSYNAPRVLDESVSNVASTLNTTKSQAISQVKPQICGNAPLNGYKFIITSGSTYEQVVVCGAATQAIKKYKLPKQITFDNSSSPSILFDVSTGLVLSPGMIVISGNGKSTKITIDKNGNISTVKM